MKAYIVTVLEEETPEVKGLFGLHCEIDGEEQGTGVVRRGFADACYWIETMERNKTYG